MMRSRAAAILLGCALTSCLSSTAPERPPSITGSVVARDVRVPLGGPPSIHVKETPAACGIVFLLTPQTAIYRQTPNGRVNATASDVVVGATVEVWTDIVLESCPGQAGAFVVQIVNAP